MYFIMVMSAYLKKNNKKRTLKEKQMWIMDTKNKTKKQKTNKEPYLGSQRY